MIGINYLILIWLGCSEKHNFIDIFQQICERIWKLNLRGCPSRLKGNLNPAVIATEWSSHLTAVFCTRPFFPPALSRKNLHLEATRCSYPGLIAALSPVPIDWQRCIIDLLVSLWCKDLHWTWFQAKLQTGGGQLDQDNDNSSGPGVEGEVQA